MSSIRERFHDTAGNVTANVTDAARRVRNMYPLAEGLLTGGATAVTAFTPWGLVAHTAEKYVDIWRDIFRDK